MNMRDPVIYRVVRAHHYRTGDKWCIYPMYDFAHPLSDTKEGVTHSLCSLEFENHRPLYDWFIKEIGFEEPPRQIEFARLNINYCVTSKRKCLEMVKKGIVDGWDDPRMVTLCGMRRRGYPAAAIREFINRIGVSKAYSVVDYGLLEACVRDNLNANAPRAMAVLRPLKVIIDNYPEGQVEEMEAINNPEIRNEEGQTILENNTHAISFSRELFIEREDFMEDGGKKFLRLGPGKEVRLKNAYIIKCDEDPAKCIEKDADGNIICIHATYDPESKSGLPGANRKIKGKTLHWVSAAHSIPCEVRDYSCLWTCENPRDAIKQYEKEHGVRGIDAMRPFLNPDSLRINTEARIEEFAATLPEYSYLQFQRIGYYNVDPDSTPEKPVFNKTVGLKQ